MAGWLLRMECGLRRGGIAEGLASVAGLGWQIERPLILARSGKGAISTDPHLDF